MRNEIFLYIEILSSMWLAGVWMESVLDCAAYVIFWEDDEEVRVEVYDNWEECLYISPIS